MYGMGQGLLVGSGIVIIEDQAGHVENCRVAYS